jgi:hypothetical protein
MTNVGYLPAVTAVEVIGEYELRLTFDDGTVGDGLILGSSVDRRL